MSSGGEAEALREACAIGDVDGVASMLRRGGFDVNDRHAINGWTALHWAAKRGHATIVDLLLKYGADASVVNNKEESPGSVSTNSTVALRLGAAPIETDDKTDGKNAAKEDFEDSSTPAFVPNYIRHPPFPYQNRKESSRFNNGNDDDADVERTTTEKDINDRDDVIDGVNNVNNVNNNVNDAESDLTNGNQAFRRDSHPPHLPHDHAHHHHNHRENQSSQLLPPHLHHPSCQAFAPYPGYHPRIFVLKVRIADQLDSDFIEVDFPRLESDAVIVEDATNALKAHTGVVNGVNAPPSSVSTDVAATTAATTAASRSRRSIHSNSASTFLTALLTFESFVDILCNELRIPSPNIILKIRKLPDTIIRKDRDVHRLKDFQEIEVVLSKRPFSESSSSFRPFDLTNIPRQTPPPSGYHASPRRRSFDSAASTAAAPSPTTATILY